LGGGTDGFVRQVADDRLSRAGPNGNGNCFMRI
jgi:hypothetical protein